ncbi:hypothetical protein Poli38472_004125 [Pythium oligandrum]|uniref:Uncharacterized protein n=1 Tax=Pythium oligandrum TaxID=41045 RepID=A0A8K1FJS1_PYTOL|nr:hypothetical protein Poli38472_004125 [Pythium oligandrum]|eukprot:TMW66360.1 hypothetical protein Poli38472_004125 [Pythium oligandrum]
MVSAGSDTGRRSLTRLTHHLITPVTDRAKRSAVRFAKIVNKTEPPPRLTVGLSRRGLAIAWSIVLFFHLFNAFYTLGMAYLYHFLRKPLMEYYVEVLHMLPQSEFVWVTAIYACISAFNFIGAFQMIGYSLLYRQFVFGRVKSRGAKVVSIGESEAKPKRSWFRCLSFCLPPAVIKPFKRPGTFLKRLFRAISVRGHLFDVMMIMREMIEIGSQTYQAHSSSLLVSKIWINQLFGVLVFLNCAANTIVHILQRHETGMRRFLCTMVDLFLDFAWGFIIPGNIIFYYVPIFIAHKYSLPPEYTYSDTLYIKAILDCRQFFMVSVVDAFTTTLPYLNMFSGLRNVKVLLQLRAEEELKLRHHNAQVSAASSISSDGVNLDDGAAKAEDELGKTGPALETVGEHPQPQKRKRWFKWLVLVSIPLFGLFVLFTSINASGVFAILDACGHGCKLRMRPWFSTHCACSVMEINCYDRGINGSYEEMREIFHELDPRVLNSLIVTHCPALEVPSEIRSFSNLLGLEFYNVSIVNWPAESALSHPYFPILGYLYIARSKMDGIPDGLTHDLTGSLVDIEISGSEVGHIPDDLGTKWPNVLMFYLEFCDLQEFPVAIASMALTDLSLTGNSIASIPEGLLTNALDWMYVYLDRNPLKSLPETIGDLPSLVYLSFQFTEIKSLPPWIYTLTSTRRTRVNAHAAPVCETVESDVQVITSNFKCKNPNTFVWNGVSPLQDKDDTRRIAPDAPMPAEPEWFSK